MNVKIKLNKGCVIGVGKKGGKGKTVEVDKETAKQLIASGAAVRADKKSEDK